MIGMARVQLQAHDEIGRKQEHIEHLEKLLKAMRSAYSTMHGNIRSVSDNAEQVAAKLDRLSMDNTQVANLLREFAAQANKFESAHDIIISCAPGSFFIHEDGDEYE